jgi:acetylornithine deacetylase/succinyl-diaminopimelate desuccinylase-like protein
MTRARERFVAAAVIAFVAALVATLIVANRRAEKELRDDTYIPKKTEITPEIVRLQEYVRIDTSNPPGNEIDGARYLAAQLQRAGIAYEIIESEPRRANLYARIKGKRSGEGLILHNHIDVVPAGGKGWDAPPFSAAIRINMLHGRGAIDMKSTALCELEAFIEIARSGKTPERDIVFLATADEERASVLGIRWLLEHRPDIFDGAKYAITEGGITEMVKEQITYFGIETGSKQVVAVELNAPDEATMQRARLALEPHFRPDNADRVLPGVRRFFHAVAPRRLDYKDLLADIDASVADGKSWLLPATMRELLQNTVWARTISKRADGVFTMPVTLSNLPDEDPEQRLQWLETKMSPLGVKVGEVVRKEGPAPISPDDTPLFAMIVGEVRREFGDVPAGPEVLALSTNDARFLRPRGIICYGLQPFPIDFFQSLSVHGTNERVRLDWYLAGIRIMKRVVANYAFGNAA